MRTKRKLSCLDHIPTKFLTETWRVWQEKQREWAKFVKAVTSDRRFGDELGRCDDDLALMERTGWSATLLFEMPKYLGRNRVRRLARIYFIFRRMWENAIWRAVFGEWARAVEADLAAIARGRRANPKAGYSKMPDALLRQQIWEREIKPHLPPDFIFEFAWLGPPHPEEVARLSTPLNVAPERYFVLVNRVIRTAGIARDVAARWTREVISAQGFDLFPNSALVWDGLFRAEEAAENEARRIRAEEI